MEFEKRLERAIVRGQQAKDAHGRAQAERAMSEEESKTLHSRCRLNLVVSGGTGSGKTTLLNALSGMIDNGERVVTIEDAAELRMQQPHVVRLETRPANLEGNGEVNMRDLVKNALRMRPDRIIIGEVRAGEAFDMLQAMNTGHDGSMTTVHANTPRDALSRIEHARQPLLRESKWFDEHDRPDIRAVHA